jgi:titin
MTIGGTTPAARNIISGNEYGVYIFDNSYLNIIQGNYIGTDITGSKPLGNGEQGYISGDKVTTIPAILNTIGGSVPGAGNLISNNGGDGIEISGTSQVPDAGPQFDGSVIQGNYIGTDVTGAVAMPNAGNGIYLNEGATNNTIGGIDPGSGNLIANNAVNGVLIDPATANPGQGIANNTVGNTILSNGGTGVRINSGSQNLISENSIFGNGALGINLGGLGTSINSNCQSTVTGPNNSQNAPVLTAGTGTAFISATATDPNSNTSEFSNAVPASTSGDILSLLGSFNSLPNTTYTLEFFSSTTADPSGYGQGQTYLGNTTVTTGANCNVAVNKPVNPNDADMSVTLTGTYENVLEVGPDLGGEYYTAAVTNNGPVAAAARDQLGVLRRRLMPKPGHNVTGQLHGERQYGDLQSGHDGGGGNSEHRHSHPGGRGRKHHQYRFRQCDAARSQPEQQYGQRDRERDEFRHPFSRLESRGRAGQHSWWRVAQH